MSTAVNPTQSLYPEHRKRLEASGISEEVIRSRGYYTETNGAALRRLGYSRDQCQTPCLVIPGWGVKGKTRQYQIRPDRPRMRKGHVLKYESPAGSTLRLDVPPGVREKVLDVTTPLYLVEGVFKADAAATRGLACVATLGVYGWGNDAESWDAIPLNGRTVYIAFDSDVRVNKDVHRAADRLASFLKERGAKAEFFVLPEGEDGAKVGLDDFFASGKTVDDLSALAVAELPPLAPSTKDPSASPVRYENTDDGTFRVENGKDGEVRTRLANFAARITAELVYVENPLKPREFEIEVRLNGKTEFITLPADEFERMNWVIPLLGGGAIISPGFGVKDEVRAAIQLASGDIKLVPTFERTGWVEVDGHWGFLHADGVIHADSGAEKSADTGDRNGSNGCSPEDLRQADPKTPNPGSQAAFPDVRVRLSSTLSRYRLPQPRTPEEHIEAVRHSLAFLDLAPDRITFPLFAFLWRVLVDVVRYSLFLVGSSGIGKTELSALIVQHLGPEMDSEHLPESFASTAYALAGTGHDACNVPLVVDDFVPTGSKGKIQRTHDQAEHVIRSQGNRAGRNRCNRDGSTIGGREPRCGFLFSGEEAPQGVSLGARYFLQEVERGDILDPTDPAKNAEIARYQGVARDGWLALATSGFLKWLAPRLLDERRDLAEQKLEFRELFRDKSSHPRVADNAADLLAGLDLYLYYVKEIGAVDDQEHQRLWTRAHVAYFDLLKGQEEHRVEQDPAKRFVQLMISAMATGRAHLLDENEDPDEFGSHRLWGYEKKTIRVPADRRKAPAEAAPDQQPAPVLGEQDGRSFEEVEVYVPRGEQVGWRRHDNLFFDPEKSLGVAQRMAREAEEPPLPLGKRALGKRLAEQGFLASKGKDRNTKKVPIEGVQKEVWHVGAFKLFDFFRSWDTWESTRDEEALKEYEEAIQRFAELEQAELARRQKARDHIQGEFSKLIEPDPAPEQPPAPQAVTQPDTEQAPAPPEQSQDPSPDQESRRPPASPEDPRRLGSWSDESSFVD